MRPGQLTKTRVGCFDLFKKRLKFGEFIQKRRLRPGHKSTRYLNQLAQPVHSQPDAGLASAYRTDV